jgi:iron(III) transport system permease protein
MAVLVLTLGFFLVYPVVIVIHFSFNTARDVFVGPSVWGLSNWREAFARSGLLRSLLNSFLIFGSVTAISFPLAVLISWILARVRIPFSHGFEFLFWVAYMMPDIAVTVGWLFVADPRLGVGNFVLERVPWIGVRPLNLYSVPGIVWVHLFSGAIAQKVMLLTPAFRNMDAALEEAGRVSGESTVGTMMKVTLPIMVPVMGLVFALQLLKIFRSFEIEQILGTPVGFHVYSTMIFHLIRNHEPPFYGQAAALASITLGIVALIVPVQRWLVNRRRYTTVTGSFRPGLINIGAAKYLAVGAIGLVLALSIIVPSLSLVVGSFMRRSGFFHIDPVFTFRHWTYLLEDEQLTKALLNTLVLAASTAIISPVLFSMIAYILVRTRWPGRILIDSIIWTSGAIPGILSGLGLLFLFLGTPGLIFLYGSMWALLIVVILQGNTTGVNLSKAVFMQMGQDMEDQARVSGAGWLRTYFRIWIPLLMPTLILLGTLNFVIAANSTSSIILLAARDTVTLSILALEYTALGFWESASVISLLIMALTVGVALAARAFGLRLGVRHQY